MATHTINPCRACSADLGQTLEDPCSLCDAEASAYHGSTDCPNCDRNPVTGGGVCSDCKADEVEREAFAWMNREQLLDMIVWLSADCDRLRRELDDATGVIR
jgi:hypothetical protein